MFVEVYTISTEVKCMAIHNKNIKSMFGRRNPNAPNHWEKIDIKEYKPNKPMVICLSGNGAVTEKDANGFCKRAERQLELLFKNSNKETNEPSDYVEIIGCSYGHQAHIKIPDMNEDEKKKFFEKYPNIPDYIRDNPDSISYDKTGHMNDEELNSIVDNILFPLCVSENNEKLSVDEASKNLSQVTFFTWCHGAIEVYKLMATLRNKCNEVGYTDEEVCQIFSSCMQVSYSPNTLANYTPSVRIDSLEDGMNMYLDEDCDDLNGILIKKTKNKTVFEHIQIYSSKLTNGMTESVNEHDVGYLDRDDGWNLKTHANADAVSQMMSWALCRSVENSLQNSKSDKYIPKMSLTELMSELESVRNAFSNEELMRRE